MTEVGTAPSTLDLGAHAVRIGQTAHRARDLLVEARPSTVSIELVVRSIQWRVASLARVNPRRLMMFVLPRERSLRSLANDDPFLGT